MTKLTVKHRHDAMRIASSLTNAGIAYEYKPYTFNIHASSEVLRHVFRLMPDVARMLADQKGFA